MEGIAIIYTADPYTSQDSITGVSPANVIVRCGRCGEQIDAMTEHIAELCFRIEGTHTCLITSRTSNETGNEVVNGEQ